MIVEFYISSAGEAGDSHKLLYGEVALPSGGTFKESTLFDAYESSIFYSWRYKRAQKRIIRKIKRRIVSF